MVEREIDVFVEGATLGGTLCLPGEKGSFPCVVMIHGSGPLDRDENGEKHGNVNIFNTIARDLASRGIASVRYDKRGCARSSGNFQAAGFHDLVEDAKAVCLHALSQQETWDDSLFLLGHSEGALIASKLSLELTQVAGLVLLAGALQRMEDVLRYQARRIKEDVERAGGLRRHVMRLGWRLMGDPEALQSLVIERVRASTEPSLRYRGQAINARWLRERLEEDPAETMRHVTCPMLAITGDKDVQVDPQDAARMAELAAGDVEYHVVPNLTHILRTDEGPASILSYKDLLKRPVEPSVLELIGAWLERQAATAVRPEETRGAPHRQR